MNKIYQEATGHIFEQVSMCVSCQEQLSAVKTHFRLLHPLVFDPKPEETKVNDPDLIYSREGSVVRISSGLPTILPHVDVSLLG